MLEFNAEISQQIELTDEIYNDILLEVGKDVIKEIKSLIKKGKNIHNEDLIGKANGETPDFYETGKLLNNLDFKIEKGNLYFYVSDSDRNQVLYDLQSRKDKNWQILDNSTYIQNFIAKRLDFHIEQILNSHN